jgi:hypothetical protein
MDVEGVSHAAARQGAHQNWLVHAAGLDALSQLGQLDRVEALPRVGQAGRNGGQGEGGELVLLGGLSGLSGAPHAQLAGVWVKLDVLAINKVPS